MLPEGDGMVIEGGIGLLDPSEPLRLEDGEAATPPRPDDSASVGTISIGTAWCCSLARPRLQRLARASDAAWVFAACALDPRPNPEHVAPGWTISQLKDSLQTHTGGSLK